MEAGPSVVGPNTLLHGSVGNGEERVHAEHRPDERMLLLFAMRDKVRVLADGGIAFFLPVPLADLIAEHCADAKLFGNFFDCEQAPFNFAVACVVVEHRRTPGFNGIDVGGIGASARVLQSQIAVEPPPHAVEHFIKVCGVVPFHGKAAGESTVNVRVRVDEGRHDDAALCIHELRVRILCTQRGGFAGFNDFCSGNGYAAVFDVRVGAVSRDEPSVCNENHGEPPYVVSVQDMRCCGETKKARTNEDKRL